MNELWLIRHGETEWSVTGQHTGLTDIPLTEAGRAQARSLHKILAGHRFAQVLSSPLQRAHETARLAGYGDILQVEPNLHEWDYGDYEGRTSDDIRATVPDWTIWHSAVPNGETIAQVAARAEAVIQRVEAIDGDVAIFAHGHILRVLTTCWLGLPPENGGRFALGTAAIGRLGYERETRVLLQWNASE
jgi:probable phosphoglycerate mutase